MKKLIVATGILVAAIITALIGFRVHTKSFSPHDKVTYSQDASITVQYSRPYKRGREVFGQLVPYNQLWRTGANEATHFYTDKDLLIKDKLLKAGTYTLFTIPKEESWTIIFNKETGQWGIDPFTMEVNRDINNDALTIEATSIKTTDMFEQFTIGLEQMGNEIEMVMMWDHTVVVIPMIPVAI